MSIQNLEPTAVVTPNAGGTLAVSSPSTTGHGSTNVEACGEGFSQAATCRWHTFQTPPSGQVVSITLKLNWSADGTSGVFSSNGFFLEYTINGGASWSDIFSQLFVTSPIGASPSISIPANTPISQIQVRDSLSALGGTFEGFPDCADLQASVSDIRLEVETIDQPMPICIW
jgi:hypothetical protein